MVTQVETVIEIPDAEPTPYPTAEDIIAAFRRHGIKPAPGSLFSVDADENGKPLEACALGVLCFDRVGSRIRSMLLCEILPGIPSNFIAGIARGFDGLGLAPWQPSPLTTQGHEIGATVRRWAFGEPS